MNGELDEKALAEARSTFAMENSLERAIRAYLAASPSPSEMDVVATAWEGYWPGAGSISSTTKLTKDQNTAARWQDDGAEIEPLVALSGAQSALAAMRAERDELAYLHSERDQGDKIADEQLAGLRAQVLRLTEENEALRAKNAVLSADGIAARKSAANNLARAEAAEARIKALEEVKAQASDLVEAIIKGYPDPNVNHEDFRVRVTQWAEDFRTEVLAHALKENAL